MLSRPKPNGLIEISGTCPNRHQCTIQYELVDGKLMKKKYVCSQCAISKPRWGQPLEQRPYTVVNQEKKGGDKMSKYSLRIENGRVFLSDLARLTGRPTATFSSYALGHGIKMQMMEAIVRGRSRGGKLVDYKKNVNTVTESEALAMLEYFESAPRYIGRKWGRKALARHRKTAPAASPQQKSAASIKASETTTFAEFLRTVDDGCRKLSLMKLSWDNGNVTFLKLTEGTVKLS